MSDMRDMGETRALIDAADSICAPSLNDFHEKP